MEDVVNPWAGCRAFLTGHTGFKGAWLARRGAHVRGYSLDRSTEPNLFNSASVASVVEDIRGDAAKRYSTLAACEGTESPFAAYEELLKSSVVHGN